MRTLQITPKENASLNALKQQLSKSPALNGAAVSRSFYLSDYADNVFPAAREAITKGRFHDMFMSGDGQELEDFTDNIGRHYRAHAKAVHSSSMLAFNFFHWVSRERPLTLNGVKYDKVYFEVKFKVLDRNEKGYPLQNNAANMDVVLVSSDCKTMLCIESKFTEHWNNKNAFFHKPYMYVESYCKGNPYADDFSRMAAFYNGRSNGYYYGIKQNICHLIALSNIKHDADSLAWFRGNNPCIEAEVAEQIDAGTRIIFTNLLYFPQDPQATPEETGRGYADLLVKLESELPDRLREELVTQPVFHTYAELLAKTKDQMPEGLPSYLSDRYLL